MKRVFAPGCALLIYKPALAGRLSDWISSNIGPMEQHLTCCHHDPGLPPGTQVVNVCPGCDRRYRELYEGITTISLWDLLAGSDFPFPDYHGRKMSILDACPTRDQPRVHDAVRALCTRMNIEVVEPRDTRTRSVCCGDSFYGVLPVHEVKAQMKKRALSMPAEDVIVYCVSCCKSMHIGGKRPRYLVDLLFDEQTLPGTFEPDDWHRELDIFIATH